MVPDLMEGGSLNKKKVKHNKTHFFVRVPDVFGSQRSSKTKGVGTTMTSAGTTT